MANKPQTPMSETVRNKMIINDSSKINHQVDCPTEVAS